LRLASDARVILVQSAPRLLVPFDPVLSENARLSLLKLNVEVRLDQAVTMCDAKGVSVGGERVEAATIIWAAGVMASPAGNWLGAETDNAGRVKVQPNLSIPGFPDIFVAGDTAHCADGRGKPLPGVASVAKQQGEYIARLLIKTGSRGRSSGFPLSRPCHDGDDRAQASRRTSRWVQTHWLRRLGSMVRRTHLLPDRL
jgi:NADH dehydrogenase FAD-containing subunit